MRPNRSSDSVQNFQKQAFVADVKPVELSLHKIYVCLLLQKSGASVNFSTVHWLIHSRASSHMTPSRSQFSNLCSTSSFSVHMEDDSHIFPTEKAWCTHL